MDMDEIMKLRPIILAFLNNVETKGFALDFNRTNDRYRELYKMVQKASGDQKFHMYVDSIGNTSIVGSHPLEFEGVATITNSGRQLIAYIDNILKVYQQKSKKEKRTTKTPDVKRVFVVHGRNLKIRDSMFEFLRSIGVEPIEWTYAKKLTGKTSPYIGEILNAAFTYAQAIIALFTPDDEAKLTSEFQLKDDEDYEKKLTPQARPNVIFETGMAFGFCPERTIIVEFGQLRPFSDIGGRHIIRFDGSDPKRYELIEMLKTAGVVVDISGKTSWLTIGDFSLQGKE